MICWKQSLLAAGGGGTVPVRTEVAHALHSLLLCLHTLFIFSVVLCVCVCVFFKIFCNFFVSLFFVRYILYSCFFSSKGGRGEHWEGWSIILFSQLFIIYIRREGSIGRGEHSITFFFCFVIQIHSFLLLFIFLIFSFYLFS